MATMARSDFEIGMVKEMYEYYFETYPLPKPKHETLFDVRKSEASFERSTSVVNLGEIPEKGENEPIEFQAAQEGYTVQIKNRSFARGAPMSKELVDDHQKIKGFLKKTVAGWSDSVFWTKEAWAAKIFNYGGITAGHSVYNGSIGANSDASGNKIYDGTNFFPLTGGTKHAPRGTGVATYYNGHSLTLNHQNLETMWVHMVGTNNRNEAGEIINLSQYIDTLLVPPGLGPTANRIMKSEWQSGSALNDTNVMRNKFNVVEWDNLSAATSWGLGCSKKGIVFYEREAPEFDFYYDRDLKQHKATIFLRFGAGVENWRYWSFSNLATSA